jgi:hypothetical protein
VGQVVAARVVVAWEVAAWVAVERAVAARVMVVAATAVVLVAEAATVAHSVGLQVTQRAVAAMAVERRPVERRAPLRWSGWPWKQRRPARGLRAEARTRSSWQCDLASSLPLSGDAGAR